MGLTRHGFDQDANPHAVFVTEQKRLKASQRKIWTGDHISIYFMNVHHVSVSTTQSADIRHWFPFCMGH